MSLRHGDTVGLSSCCQAWSCKFNPQWTVQCPSCPLPRVLSFLLPVRSSNLGLYPKRNQLAFPNKSIKKAHVPLFPSKLKKPQKCLGFVKFTCNLLTHSAFSTCLFWKQRRGKHLKFSTQCFDLISSQMFPFSFPVWVHREPNSRAGHQCGGSSLLGLEMWATWVCVNPPRGVFFQCTRSNLLTSFSRLPRLHGWPYTRVCMGSTNWAPWV